MTIRQLMTNQTPGGRGLLAAEILVKQNRQHGPTEAKCETCGYEWNGSFTLDWATLEWQCKSCAISSMLSERGEVPASVAGNL